MRKGRSLFVHVTSRITLIRNMCYTCPKWEWCVIHRVEYIILSIGLFWHRTAILVHGNDPTSSFLYVHQDSVLWRISFLRHHARRFGRIVMYTSVCHTEIQLLYNTVLEPAPDPCLAIQQKTRTDREEGKDAFNRGTTGVLDSCRHAWKVVEVCVGIFPPVTSMMSQGADGSVK